MQLRACLVALLAVKELSRFCTTGLTAANMTARRLASAQTAESPSQRSSRAVRTWPANRPTQSKPRYLTGIGSENLLLPISSVLASGGTENSRNFLFAGWVINYVGINHQQAAFPPAPTRQSTGKTGRHIPVGAQANETLRVKDRIERRMVWETLLQQHGLTSRSQ